MAKVTPFACAAALATAKAWGERAAKMMDGSVYGKDVSHLREGVLWQEKPRLLQQKVQMQSKERSSKNA